MHAKLARELIERHEFGVPRVLRHRDVGSLKPRRRNRSQSAVPHPKRVQGHADQRGTFLLRDIGGTTPFTQGSHRVHTMPRAKATALPSNHSTPPMCWAAGWLFVQATSTGNPARSCRGGWRIANYFLSRFSHRATAALFAISLRCVGESLAALAITPFAAPALLIVAAAARSVCTSGSVPDLGSCFGMIRWRASNADFTVLFRALARVGMRQ